MKEFCGLKWEIGDRVRILRKSDKSVQISLNGERYILSINNPIGRRLSHWPVDTRLVIVDKRTVYFDAEGKFVLPWADNCIGQIEVPVYIACSL